MAADNLSRSDISSNNSETIYNLITYYGYIEPDRPRTRIKFKISDWAGPTENLNLGPDRGQQKNLSFGPDQDQEKSRTHSDLAVRAFMILGKFLPMIFSQFNSGMII